MKKHQSMYTSNIKNKISILYQLIYFLWEIFFFNSETAIYSQESPAAAGYVVQHARTERSSIYKASSRPAWTMVNKTLKKEVEEDEQLSW